MTDDEPDNVQLMERVVLPRIAELVDPDDVRRRHLEAFDACAQMALDRVTYFEGTGYPAPDIGNAIKALVASAALLVPEFDAARVRKGTADQKPIVEAIRAAALEGERLRLVGKQNMRDEATR